jgi:GT2 family glycosyltransferase
MQAGETVKRSKPGESAPVPLVSLVVLNYNGEEIIEECIASLQKTTYPNYEIIVVDNASTDGSWRILSALPRITAFKTEKNLGYAGGNNFGIAKVKGKYFATFNNDSIVEPDWLNDPVSYLESDDSLGIVSCRQMDYWHRELVDALFATVPANLAPRHIGAGLPYAGLADFHHTGLVLIANGASAIYRKACIDDIGTFDAAYFAYHEESDLCLRGFLFGWKCLYVPSAVVYHRHGHSFNKRGGMSFYLSERNRYWFMFKFFPLTMILKNFLHLLKWELWAVKCCLLRKQRFRDLVSARKDGLCGLQQFASERKRLVGKFKEREKEFALYQQHPLLEYTPAPER